MRLLKEMVIILVGIIAAIYLVNPTFGLFELLPDNLPLVGNLDEAGATGILLSVFAYYGLDFSHLFGRQQTRKSMPVSSRRQPDIIVQEPTRPADKDKR